MKFVLIFAALVRLSFGEGAFDTTEAKRGWQLVNAAYCSETSIVGWSCDNCAASGLSLVDVHFMSDPNYETQAFVGYSPTVKAIILSFRGTSNIENWVSNLDFFQSSYPNCASCHVHTGFYQAYLSLAPEVRMYVQTMVTQYKAPVRIYGHSLGGALAVHAMADLQVHVSVGVEFVYTYGQPRVGDKAFATWYNNLPTEHNRVTHYKDIVPHVPPESFDFFHTAREVWYTEDSSSYQVCDGSGEDGKCSDSGNEIYSVSDHLSYMGGSCCCPTQNTKNTTML